MVGSDKNLTTTHQNKHLRSGDLVIGMADPAHTPKDTVASGVHIPLIRHWACWDVKKHWATHVPSSLHSPTPWANVTSPSFRAGHLNRCCNELLFVWPQAVSDEARCRHSDSDGSSAVSTESPSHCSTFHQHRVLQQRQSDLWCPYSVSVSSSHRCW